MDWEYFKDRIEEIICNRCGSNVIYCERCEMSGDLYSIKMLIEDMKNSENTKIKEEEK